MVKTPSKQLVISSSLSEAHQAQLLIMKEVEAVGYSEDACFAIRLSLDEAISNAVRHGNRCDPQKKVTIDYSITSDTCRFCICDEGPGFKPDCVPDPTADENLDKPNGRGVMLIHAYMTSVSYNAKGNCLTMTKDRTCPKPAG